MTPKTPPGPKLWSAVSIPAQAAKLLTSKKYVHSSMVPTKLTAALGANGSFSQNRLNNALFLRTPS